MTDFHAHFLPGIDDGSRSVEMSLTMLEMWQQQGIDRLCATPHFYAEHTSPRRFLENREFAFRSLTEAMQARGLEVPILLGAEVRFFDGISGVSELRQLCLQGTDLLLVEMPFTRWTDRMLLEIDEIRRRGLQPVAAHIERYMDLNPRRTMERFLDMDILIQCNAEFFLSRHTARKALRMLADERIHFLGSDAHNITSRAPNLGPALDRIEQKLGPRALDRLVRMEELFLQESGQVL